MPFDLMKNIILYTLASFLLIGCEMDADIELPELDPMLNVTCFISPQDTVHFASVSRVNPLFGDNDDVPYAVDNAIVTISNGLQSAQFNYDINFQYYTLHSTSFSIVEGETYTLRVEAPGYPTWTATTIVPNQMAQNVGAEIKDFSPSSGDFGGNYNFELELYWDDVTIEDSYYRGAVVYRDTLEFDGYVQIYNSEVVGFLERDGETNQGQIRMIKTGTVYYPSNQQPNSLVFYLLHVNKDYYDFHKSLENMDYGSPFSEPTLVYTNASGGLGCFGAYQQTKTTIQP